MHWLQRSGLKTARAWRLKEALREIYGTQRDPTTVEHDLRRWISWARRSRLTPFKTLGATIRTHLAGIVEHFRSGLSNGHVEAMNALIQAAKARAKGYATTEHDHDRLPAVREAQTPGAQSVADAYRCPLSVNP